MSPLGSVSVRDANLTVTTAPAPVPAGSTHSIEVVVIQILTVHCVKPIDIDGDVSVGPKFVPDNMSVEPPVVGPLMFESTKAHVGYQDRIDEPHPMYIARLLLNDSPLAKSSAAARLLTRATFQLPRFWSNPPAPCSMPYRFATLATFHIPMFWLNAADVPTHAHRR